MIYFYSKFHLQNAIYQDGRYQKELNTRTMIDYSNVKKKKKHLIFDATKCWSSFACPDLFYITRNMKHYFV